MEQLISPNLNNRRRVFRMDRCATRSECVYVLQWYKVRLRTLNHCRQCCLTLIPPRCTDISDPGHFGPKTGSYFFSVGAELSLRHFSTSAEPSQHFMKGPKCPTDTSALVPNCLGQIGGAFLFLYRFTTSSHICTIHRDLQTASQDIFVYTKSYPTFKFDS